jgi:hypothetical protein
LVVVLHAVLLIGPLEVLSVLLETGKKEAAIDSLSILLKAYSNGFFAEELQSLCEGEV